MQKYGKHLTKSISYALIIFKYQEVRTFFVPTSAGVESNRNLYGISKKVRTKPQMGKIRIRKNQNAGSLGMFQIYPYFFTKQTHKQFPISGFLLTG